MIKLLTAEPNKVRQIVIAYLVKNKAFFVTQGGGDAYFSKCCAHIQVTDAEIAEGKGVADPILAEIEAALAAHVQTLPTKKLTNEYILGSHYGDGSFYFALSWKPTPKGHRLRCEPEWSISGENKAYCQAFENTFNGKTCPVDKKGQQKFVLSGVKKCLSIIPLFDEAQWMPAYKREQYGRWKEALYLVNKQQHFTEEGVRKLLDLTYNLAEKGARAYDKKQYLEWGLAWVASSTRQKRQPRRDKLNQ